MTTVNNNQMEKIPGYFVGASVLILAAHIYLLCNGLYHADGVVGAINDRLCEVIRRLPGMVNDTKAKILALVCLLPGIFAFTRPSKKRISWTGPLVTFCVGLLLYLSSAALTPVDGDPSLAYCYIAVTGIGYLLIIGSSARLSAGARYAFRAKEFEPDTEGFKQEERLIETPVSLNFRGQYRYNGRDRKSYINIVNPRRGVLIMGSPGSGKSWFVIEPAIEQLTQKGVVLFVYDFKYPALTEFTYNQFQRNRRHYPESTRFVCINFTDLSRSHRCNIIDPVNLKYMSDALDIAKTIMHSINKTWVSRQGEFFVESPINFLGALIWFLRGYKDGVYCTLPHVIELSKTSYEELFTILNAEPSTRGLASPFKEAYLNKTTEMLDGQIASAKVPLARLESIELYYVLSGNDVNLNINDPKAPVILCLGGDSERQQALAPILSVYIDMINKKINRPDRHPTALILDEFATVRATSVQTIIATGRSNNIIPILAIQDISQLKSQYTQHEAEQFMNTAGNLICGQVAGETADLVSKRFHATLHLKTTISMNSSDVSTSKTPQAMETVTPATLATLSAGEFVGIVADDPDKEIGLKGFFARFVKKGNGEAEQQELPIVKRVDKPELTENADRIVKEVDELVKEEMRRILDDPQLRRWVVRR
jgi:hypothetical protein